MNPKENYRAGLYCRLSEDDDQQGESASIATQRAILSAYCQEQGYEIHDVYVDDGFSGLNFERPDFQRLTIWISSRRFTLFAFRLLVLL